MLKELRDKFSFLYFIKIVIKVKDIFFIVDQKVQKMDSLNLNSFSKGLNFL